MKEFTYDVVEKIGVLSESEDGRFTTEINRISYNGQDAKIDIRKWNRETNRMGKGVTLTDDEVEKLKQILLGM